MPDATQSALGSESAVNRAECDVDLRVRERFFPAQPSGVFVEIGAARPDYLSVSALYRSLGWHIVAIEPNPAYKPLYDERGYQVLQYACGDRDEDDVPFSVVNSHVKDIYGGGKQLDIIPIKVKLRRLDTILADHAPTVTRVDIVCADIEGWELEALSGLNFQKYDPQVLIVENLFCESRYRSFMKERGYRLWRRLGPNDVYAKRSLFRPAERWTSPVRNLPGTVVGRIRSTLRSFFKRR
jgi:FkbM family methyltransferase